MKAERRFHRVVDLLGEEGFRRVRRSRVTVVGLGGVGCHAAMALARSGTGSLCLVDFDRLTETSLNRNPLAGPPDVGRFKVDIVAESLSASCPDTEVKVFREFFHEDTAGLILDPAPDALIDAIDSLNPKAALLEQCVLKGIPAFSSMGASGRSDPGLLRTGDIWQTRCCPLARQLRKRLRRRGVLGDIACVYSLEPARGHSLPADEEDVTLRRGRVRNRIPSLMTMPGSFGYALAGMVLDRLAGRCGV